MSEYIITDEQLASFVDQNLRLVSFHSRVELIDPASGRIVCELPKVKTCHDVYAWDGKHSVGKCSECGELWETIPNYCKECGARVH